MKLPGDHFRYLLLLLLIPTLFSCSSVRVQYDYERDTDFTSYSTYNYYPDLQSGLSELDEGRLIRALDSVMQAKGYLLSEEADFFINIFSSSFRNPQGSAVGVGVGGTGRNVGGGVSIGLPLGQGGYEREIVFDLIDSQKDALFWQAVSNCNYRENASPAEREEILQAVVARVFSKFPPSR